MDLIEKRPPWFDGFSRLIGRSWTHYGPCRNLHLASAFDTENSEWQITAAPIFQEIVGGEDDGKTVWTGFVFQADKLMRAMTVKSISAASVWHAFNPTPTLTIQGRYRGQRVCLKVLLEPVPGTPVVEIIDTLKCEIRGK